METFVIETDSHLCCKTATSFPGGVLQAHQTLHSIIPFSNTRKYYGLSWPKDGTIIYKAAAEILNDEERNNSTLEHFVLKKGTYIFVDIKNFKDDIPAIGKTFIELLKDPGIDPKGECVEWYLNDSDVRCMVRLSNKN